MLLAVLGTITGTVVFDGAAPARAELERDADPVCAKTRAQAEDVVVTDGKLRDVVVHVVKGVKPTAAPADPVVITQKDCRYQPHVSAVIAGGTLSIQNGDPTYHNVHGTVAGKNVWNESQPAGQPALVKDAPTTVGAVVSHHCDVHAWMQAWTLVVANPVLAVTGDDGAFALPDLPPGTYTIEAWHPVLGAQSKVVRVGKGKAAAATLTFHFKAK